MLKWNQVLLGQFQVSLYRRPLSTGACVSKDHEDCSDYPMHECDNDWLVKNCKRKCGLCKGTYCNCNQVKCQWLSFSLSCPNLLRKAPPRGVEWGNAWLSRPGLLLYSGTFPFLFKELLHSRETNFMFQLHNLRLTHFFWRDTYV